MILCHSQPKLKQMFLQVKEESKPFTSFEKAKGFQFRSKPVPPLLSFIKEKCKSEVEVQYSISLIYLEIVLVRIFIVDALEDYIY